MATKYPPQLSVGESIRVIKEMYSTHKSKEVSIDLMPDILRIKQKSSYFPAGIASLQKFGLVEKRPHSIIKLTDLAMQIIEPIGSENIEAITNLFKKDEVLSALLDKYPNGTLPSEEQLKQTLMKVFNIPRSTVGRWYQFVFESFRELPKGEKSIEQYPQTLVSAKRADVKLGGGADFRFSKTQNIQLPSGKIFSFDLEEGYNLDDLEFIIDFFELKKKRLK